MPSLGTLAYWFHCLHLPKAPLSLHRARPHGRKGSSSASLLLHTYGFQGGGPCTSRMQHRTLFIVVCVFLILFQSRGKQLWGQGKPFTLGCMSKGSCAFSQRWTQWWSNSIYIQHSSGAAASHSSAVSDMHEAGQSSFHHYTFSSFGVYTCVLLQRLWPNSFFPQGGSAQLPHKVQIRITFLDKLLESWPQAQLLCLTGEAYYSLEKCPKHTME